MIASSVFCPGALQESLRSASLQHLETFFFFLLVKGSLVQCVHCVIKLGVKQGRRHVGFRGESVCHRSSRVSCDQFAFSASSPLHSFAFPEDQVQAAADQSHGEADPGQDVGGAVGALLQADRVEAVLLSRVDGGCDHHAQAWRGRVREV